MVEAQPSTFLGPTVGYIKRIITMRNEKQGLSPTPAMLYKVAGGRAADDGRWMRLSNQ